MNSLSRKLLAMWSASLALLLLLVGLAFSQLLERHYAESSLLHAKDAFASMERRLGEREQRLLALLSSLLTRGDILSSLNLLSRYQNPDEYRPLIFDEEKKAIAARLSSMPGIGTPRATAAFDAEGRLAAFHLVMEEGKETKGIVSYDTLGQPKPLLIDPHPDIDISVMNDLGLMVERRPGDWGTGLSLPPAGLAMTVEAPVTRHRNAGEPDFLGSLLLLRILGPLFVDEMVRETGHEFGIILPDGRTMGSTRLPPKFTDENGFESPVIRYQGDTMVGVLRKPVRERSTFATFVVSVTRADISAQMRAFTTSAAVTFILIVVFLLPLAAFVIGRIVSRPVESLIKGVEAVKSGRFDALTDFHSGDELGRLARSFDEMANAIREREEELVKAQEELEAIIEDRTHALKDEVRERCRTEFELRKLSRAVEESPAVVVITDTKGRIEYVNPRFTAVTGYAADEVIGQTPAILNSGNVPRSVYDDMWQTISTGNIWRGEFENRRKNGSTYWVLASISPIRDEEGGVTHFVAVQEDVTERKMAEQELREAKELAEKANRAKSEFLSSMSHELRTPMNAILGFAQVLQSGGKPPLTDRQRGHVEHILDAGRHLLELINEVLDLARIEAGKLTLTPENINPGSIIEECLIIAGSLADKRGIKVEDRTQGTDPPMIRVDPLRTRQVLINLLSNAVKYNRDGGLVTLECGQEEKGFLRIKVTDTGPGIPADRQEQLFQPFSRLGAENGGVEGSGIGLTITRSIVE